MITDELQFFTGELFINVISYLSKPQMLRRLGKRFSHSLQAGVERDHCAGQCCFDRAATSGARGQVIVNGNQRRRRQPPLTIASDLL